MDPVLIQLLKILGVIAATFGLYRGLLVIYEELTSPVRDLPGPDSQGWLYGNMKDIWAEEESVLYERWVEQYGSTLKYHGLFGIQRLFTMDSKALNHVLMNTDIYQMPDAVRYILGRVVGNGLFVAKGSKHKQQRKVMNPAFGPAQVRELTQIFVAKSQQLRDIWAADIAKEGGQATRFEVLSWLSRATLDMIGLAGFNYKFDALSDRFQENELNAAFATVFFAATSVTLIPMIKAFFPALRFLRAEKDSEIESSHKIMTCIGRGLLRESKISIEDKSASQSRDLLTLLVRSNMNDHPGHQPMSDEDVIDQVPTFLVAGHETTSTATTWALYALCKNLETQTKLREELLTLDTDSPTMDDLNSLPYLDAVVRETLRIHAPVPGTFREATRDDIIPLNKPFTDRQGVVHDVIRVRKGQMVHVPILALNRSKDIWGNDAREFRPERWESTPEAATGIPGVWGNMLTFLGGPRSCIGYRFSLVEMKALLFTLVRAFEFKLAVPVVDVTKNTAIVQRPLLASDPKAGNQLPVFVRPFV